MPDEKNFMRWHFGRQASKDAIIVGLMNDNDQWKRDNEELRRRLDKLEHPDNIPEALKELERRSRNPLYKLSESMEIIKKNSVI